MDIRLISLEIEQFKGIRHTRLDFGGKPASIYGDNATGKTTVYDALTWLLFGKTSDGSSKFSVKPIGQTGVTPTVTAVLDVDGAPMQLRRTLRERWSKPRGCAVAQYDGDTTEYTIDDVPRKEGEYKRIISGLVSEDVFRLLTNVHAFARDLPWKERRRQLAEVCGLPDDREIMAGTFDALAGLLGRRTVDEYKAALMAERKGANKTLDSLPIRIDECERRVSELRALDYDRAQRDKDALEARKQDLLADLSRLDGGALLTAAQADIRQAEAAVKALDAENAAHRASQIVPAEDARPAMRRELDGHLRTLRDAERMARDCQDGIQSAEGQLDTYRAAWRAIQDEVFAGDTCPTCGQALPPVQAAQARAKFERDKAARAARLVQDSDLVKESICRQQAQLDGLQRTAQQAQAEAERVQAQLEAYQPPEAPEITNLPGYAARRAQLAEQVQTGTARVARIQDDQQAERGRIRSALAETDRALAQAAQVLAARAQLDETAARVDALKQEQRAQAAALEEIDRKLAMCEDFTRYRCQFITDAVNSRFQLARFRLFVQQVNGGLADCCDVTVDGVPYADLNNAMQINVGLDIIGTLSAHYGLRVPLFVDNAEAVTALQEIDTQVIRLVVSEQDKELRMV